MKLTNMTKDAHRLEAQKDMKTEGKRNISVKKQELKYQILTRDKRYKREFNKMRMLRSNMPYLPKICIIFYFSLSIR